MCGIYGHYNLSGADRSLVERMAHRLNHRGPDGYGIHETHSLVFGAGRLAIIDLAAASGPIFNEDRTISVAYNGEIYNYRALRAELEKEGHHFYTQTDTEVIVHGYEAWGDGVLARLRGMFALALWDEPKGRLLLARDRLGEKPLYFAQVDVMVVDKDYRAPGFIFASEIKALFEHPGLIPAVNQDALPLYLTLGYVPAPQTLFRGIEKLSPGEWLVLDQNGIRRGRYWQPVMDTLTTPDYKETVRQVRQAFVEAVEMRLMSDVPLGAFLSGGLDSTAVVAVMSQAMKQPVKTFTVGFNLEGNPTADRKFNADARFAALAADHFGSDHHMITIRPDTQLAEWLPHLIYAMDEPVAQQSIFQTPYVAALARHHNVPVLLTGDGGDELFAGYNHFRADRLLERYLLIPGLLRNGILNPLIERLPARFDRVRKISQKSRDVDSVRRYLSWKRNIDLERLPELMTDQESARSGYDLLSQILLPLLNAPRTRHFGDRIAFTGMASWLAEDSNMRVDKMCMLMSTEARAPIEDHQLVELALRIPLEYKLRGGDFKRVFKDAVSDWIPEPILTRPKWGFAPPISEWLRTILLPLVKTHLSPERVNAVGFFRPEAVANMIDRHINQRQYDVWALWTVLVFHIWYSIYIDGSLRLNDPLTPFDLVSDISSEIA